jgi:hypothetical protein
MSDTQAYTPGSLSVEDGCCIDDIRIEMSTSVSVDGNGEPILDWAPQLDPAGDSPYWCMACQDSFKGWDRVLQHLEESERALGYLEAPSVEEAA